MLDFVTSTSTDTTVERAVDGLYLFTRFPLPGQTKTRLIPALGAVGAADLQRQMTEHLLRRFQGFCPERSLSLDVHFTGGTYEQMSGWLGDEAKLTHQCEGTLGERLTFALQSGFAAGLERIVIVGSDCPDVTEDHIDQAMTLLQSQDVVLGPAVDGGYYLVGLSGLYPALFENIPWSTKRVLETTLEIAHRCGLSVALLNWLSDVDRPEDLPLWNDRKSAYSVGFNSSCHRGL